jgi:tRNA1(Val) A37 N6-methylase TrmN6
MTSTLDAEGLTHDAFLGGRLQVWQPANGYRAGVDPVLLAASVRAVAGQSVLELGCGVGVASLCLGTRVGGLALCGIEFQSDYADLAERNAAENRSSLVVVRADLSSLPGSLRQQSFDHVMMNPPFFDRGQGTASHDAGRDLALGGETPLSAWVETATRRLRPGGSLTVIQSTPRLPEILGAMDQRLGSVTLLPLAARSGRASTRFLLRAIKGGRTPFRLLATCLLHAGERHVQDGDDYAPAIATVLRDGAALNWGD